jgi:ribosomal protein L11 methyltransferase
MTSASQNKIWYSAEIEALREAADAVEFALLESGALGTEISMSVKDKDAPAIKIVGYFNERVELREKLNEALEIYDLSSAAVKDIRWGEVEQRDWLEEWKKSWQPVVSGRFVVAPTWSEIPDPENNIIIRIEPGMAFGTGTHETTRLCLSAIDKEYKGGSFLDVGTGTAVLAIAAAKMFPDAKIEACDTDVDSVRIARENAALNDAADRINFYEGSIAADTETFDFICANLTADVIIPLLPLLVEKSKETLALSGILVEQEGMVTNRLKELGQDKFSIDHFGEWVLITVDRK